jgi:hypothetical protein
LVCKQGVGGSSPLVSTDQYAGRSAVLARLMRSCVEDSDRLKHDSFGSEHLLGITNEFMGLGAQIPRENKLDHSRLASVVEQALAKAHGARRWGVKPPNPAVERPTS